LADRIHKCDEGHQIQGFGGNRHKLNNNAITFSCHELVDDDLVLWQGQDMKWERFKRVIYDEKKWSIDDDIHGAK
jgi:hypothetical protein